MPSSARRCYTADSPHLQHLGRRPPLGRAGHLCSGSGRAGGQTAGPAARADLIARRHRQQSFACRFSRRQAQAGDLRDGAQGARLSQPAHRGHTADTSGGDEGWGLLAVSRRRGLRHPLHARRAPHARERARVLGLAAALAAAPAPAPATAPPAPLPSHRGHVSTSCRGRPSYCHSRTGGHGSPAPAAGLALHRSSHRPRARSSWAWLGGSQSCAALQSFAASSIPSSS